jgi:hypothetical protein
LKIKIFHLIGSRARNLPTCSIVSHHYGTGCTKENKLWQIMKQKDPLIHVRCIRDVNVEVIPTNTDATGGPIGNISDAFRGHQR